MSPRPRRSFTDEFKAETVRLIRESGKSVGTVARELDLTETAVREWVRRAKADAGQGPPGVLTTAEREALQRLRRDVRRLHMERDILEKGDGLLCQGATVKFGFIQAERATFPVPPMCRVLAVSRSGFSAWQRRQPSAHAQEDTRLSVAIRAIHTASRQTYGAPRVHAELHAQGRPVGRKRVARLMKQDGLRARRPRRWRTTTDSQHSWSVADNVVPRVFHTDAPNQGWVADLTDVWTWEGWLYLAVVLDLFARRVVGWAMADHLRTERPLAALEMALARRVPAAGLVHHSDRGVQYASPDDREVLAAHGVQVSMSRKGHGWDNAVAESFFATLKTELVAGQSWPTRRGVRDAIAEYIELFYNSRRRHSTLGYCTPMEYEGQHHQRATTAA